MMNGFTLIASLTNLNYSKIAKEMSVSPQYVQQWGRGLKNIPEEKQCKLADILQVNKKYLNNNITDKDQLELLEILISNKIKRKVGIKFID